MEKKVRLMEKGVNLWVDERIRKEMRAMQVRFDCFEQYISWQLMSIQSPDLADIHDELSVLRKSVKELHNRSILSIPIIKKIYKEEKVENI